MPQPFTVRSPLSAPGVLGTFDDQGNLILAGKLVQNGLIRPGSDHVEVPPGVTPGAFAITNNLAEVLDPAAARANLGITTTSGSGQVYPLLDGYGLLGATYDPGAGITSANTVTNNLWYGRCWVPANTPITSLWCATTVAGTWDTTSGPNYLAVSDDSGNRLGLTPDDGTMWATPGWCGAAIVGGPIAAQTTGRFVYLGASPKGQGSAFAMQFASNGSNFPAFQTGPGMTHRRSFNLSAGSGTGVPVSFDPTSYGTASAFLPLIGFK